MYLNLKTVATVRENTLYSKREEYSLLSNAIELKCADLSQINDIQKKEENKK